MIREDGISSNSVSGKEGTESLCAYKIIKQTKVRIQNWCEFWFLFYIRSSIKRCSAIQILFYLLEHVL